MKWYACSTSVRFECATRHEAEKHARVMYRAGLREVHVTTDRRNPRRPAKVAAR
jgi:homospermidine synthase